MQSESPFVLYVAGRGNSGSTILDIALSQSQSVIGLGEVVAGLLREGEICSCGTHLRSCPFWTKVLSVLADQYGGQEILDGEIAFLKSESSIVKWPKYALFGFVNINSAYRRYVRVSQSIFVAAAEVSGKSVVVDSSKEVTRALILAKGMKNGHIIHLIRDPYRMLASNIWRVESGTGFRFMRKTFTDRRARPIYIVLGAIGWLVGNVCCEVIRVAFPKRYIRVRYEDICQNPMGEFDRISEAFGISLDESTRFICGDAQAKTTHNIGGNHMRHDKNLTFDAARVIGRQSIKGWERFGARLIVGPLRWAYGYK